jgi:hypothetical protein
MLDDYKFDDVPSYISSITRSNLSVQEAYKLWPDNAVDAAIQNELNNMDVQNTWSIVPWSDIRNLPEVQPLLPRCYSKRNGKVDTLTN